MNSDYSRGMTSPTGEQILDTAQLLLPTLITGLHRIGALAQVTPEHAKEALTLISVIYETLRGGLTGEITPEGVTSALEAFRSELGRNDTKADAALAARFDASEG